MQSLLQVTAPVGHQKTAASKSIFPTSSPDPPEENDYGSWGGCAHVSPDNTLHSELPASPTILGNDSPTPPFDIRGNHRTPSPSASPTAREVLEDDHSTHEHSSGSDYGKEAEAERARRARSRERSQQALRSEDAQGAEGSPRQPYRGAPSKDRPGNTQGVVRPMASMSRLSPPGQHNAVAAPDVDYVAITTGFDSPSDVENEDDDDEQLTGTGKGKGKASVSARKGGRMSAENVALCQAFGAEVHRGALELAAQLDVNLLTVMRTADLAVKPAKIGNFANSLRMVIRHDYAERLAAGDELGMDPHLSSGVVNSSAFQIH